MQNVFSTVTWTLLNNEQAINYIQLHLVGLASIRLFSEVIAEFMTALFEK